MLRLTLILALNTASAFANGTPPEPPAEPPRVETPKSDSDHTPYQSRPDMPCCRRGDVILFHAPLGSNKAKVRTYCAALDVTLIPQCKIWRAK